MYKMHAKRTILLAKCVRQFYSALWNYINKLKLIMKGKIRNKIIKFCTRDCLFEANLFRAEHFSVSICTTIYIENWNFESFPSNCYNRNINWTPTRTFIFTIVWYIAVIFPMGCGCNRRIVQLFCVITNPTVIWEWYQCFSIFDSEFWCIKRFESVLRITMKYREEVIFTITLNRFIIMLFCGYIVNSAELSIEKFELMVDLIST